MPIYTDVLRIKARNGIISHVMSIVASITAPATAERQTIPSHSILPNALCSNIMNGINSTISEKMRRHKKMGHRKERRGTIMI